MSKTVSSFELTLTGRPRNQTLARWLYAELRGAILEGRLKSGTRLPASRDFARLHGLSRGTVVSVFEQLQTEGYLSARVGTGTWVSERVTVPRVGHSQPASPPAYVRRAITSHPRPKAFIGWTELEGAPPFRMRDPDLAAFPAKLWGRIAARRARNLGSFFQEARDDGRGYRPLREAISHYLGSSRGVRCDAGQIVIVSGVQHAIDLLARFLLRPGDPVWMEDPGYFGASIAFSNAGARVVPVPVDEYGMRVSAGIAICPGAHGAFLTPGHQYPLGMTMSLERRMEVLKWASRTGTFIIEDDYDSEYRFEERPAPSLHSLDRGANVIFVGTFTKLLFPALRLGYIVLPASVCDAFVHFRRQTDFRCLTLDQAVLCDFIVDGHFGRHLRRMRDLYAGRLQALIEGGRRHLNGLLEISGIRAGLYTAAYLRNGMSSGQAESLAAAHGIEVRALDRFALKCPDPAGLLLGFAAFNEATIHQGLVRLAEALSQAKLRTRRGLLP